ncbi:phage virion morphogenesis protein [Alcaligenaceae bacterium]|nr:phage virion morphogenesis protein [Alcaligenaceae bacterium]
MIKIELATDRLDDAFEALERATGDLGPALKNIGEAQLLSIDERFADKKAPDGSKWQSNAAATVGRKGFDEPLVGAERSLTLRTQHAYQLDTDALRVGSMMEYAAMQQFGGLRSEFPHLWGDIPARPFIGLSEDDEDEIVEIITDHIAMAAGTK